MVLLVMGWIVLSLVLGVLVGKGIHRADTVGFPSRVEPAWWLPGTPAVAPDAPDAAGVPTQGDRAGARDVVALAV